MRRVMLDLETMSTKPNAAIVAIGAVAFDPEAPEDGVLPVPFYRAVTLASCEAAGLAIDSGTVMWRLKQGEEARAALTKDALPLRQALEELSIWMRSFEYDQGEVWGNGAEFDNVILREAYRAVDLAPPWIPFKNRCYRTLKNFRPDIKLARTGTYHNAVDDARSQAEHAVRILRDMGIA